MGVEAPTVEKLAHAVFLNRVNEWPPTSAEVRLGQGAFLTLRLVDLLDAGRPPAQPDVFHYQWTATERYCAELAHEGTEAAHLNDIVQSAAAAHRRADILLIVPSLFAYVHYLEHALRLEEALDVVESVLRVGGARLSPKDAVAGHLRLGLLNRNLARFIEADAAYGAAEALAALAGDARSVLFARIGRAFALMQRGNYLDSERELLAILGDARAQGQREAEARAAHAVGTLLDKRGQPAAGAPHLWRAYGLYEDEAAKLRALGDLGTLLLRLGDVAAAERALLEVHRRAQQPDVMANARIELMHCASYRRDRVGFERWRSELTSFAAGLPPNVWTDFQFKAGIGFARFGNFRKAGLLLDEAAQTASANRLHDFEFRIERVKAGLGDCAEAAQPQSTPAAESVAYSEALREVSASLALLHA